MATRKKEPSATTGSTDDQLTDTTIKAGKALARSSFKVGDAGRRARKVAGDIMETVSRKKTPKPGPFQPATGMTVEGRVGFVAGDIYQYLKENGETPVPTLVKTIVKHGNSEAMTHAALGWLAREGKIAFSPAGDTITSIQ